MIPWKQTGKKRKFPSNPLASAIHGLQRLSRRYQSGNWKKVWGQGTKVHAWLFLLHSKTWTFLFEGQIYLRYSGTCMVDQMLYRIRQGPCEASQVAWRHGGSRWMLGMRQSPSEGAKFEQLETWLTLMNSNQQALRSARMPWRPISCNMSCRCLKLEYPIKKESSNFKADSSVDPDARMIVVRRVHPWICSWLIYL